MTEDMEPGSPSPTRILYLTDDFGGGTGNHLLGMLDRWDEDRWQPELASFARRTARRAPDVSHLELPEPAGPSLYPIHQMQRFRQVRRLVRDRSPDLLHTYFFWPILYGRILRALGDVPALVENREDEGFGWGRHEYAWLRLTRNLPDRVICVSNAVREVAQEREGLDPDRTTVIHNGVEMPKDVPRSKVRELRQDLALPPDAPVVGMVSNLNRSVKGVAWFVDVVPDILDAVPDTHFVVVGGGSDEAALRAQARTRGLGERLHFPGYREDIHRFYALMDVSVLTSRTEGLSITLLESMSHGLPVVATRVGGNPEVVVDGETGYLVPPGDRGAFVEKVEQLLNGNALRLEMGRAARRRARAEFSVDRAADEYRANYESLLGGRP